MRKWVTRVISFDYPQGAGEILSRLEEKGHKAYLVGGCVRDLLRGVMPHDFDITTSASPDEVKRVFSDRQTVDTGIRHGTVTLLMEDGAYEVTTFRVDGAYDDCRHPTAVRFTADFHEDAARRDFTVNAIGYSPKAGICDPFGGKADIEARVIRAVGDPAARFSEDALRILRALRFSSVLGFQIEEKTAAALREKKALLTAVSPERIREELSRLLVGRDAADVLLAYRDVIGTVLPCLMPQFDFDQKTPHHIYDLYRHTVEALRVSEPILPLRWAILLHDTGKPESFFLDENGVGHFYGHEKKSREIANNTLHYLRFDNKTIALVTLLVERHGLPIPTNKKEIRRALSRFGEEAFFLLMKLCRADLSALSPIHKDRIVSVLCAEEMARTVLAEETCLSLKTLAVKGDDLLAVGVPKGKRIGELLSLLLSLVIDGVIPNEREACLSYLREQHII